MIFVTVGTQLPFDRLIRTVDDWAARANRTDIFAQIGPSDYRPRCIQCAQFIDVQEFRRRVEQARIIIAHAGMGSILTVLELGKPILVMPRRADLNEHRNDHQLATARHLLAQGRVHVAFDEAELMAKLNRLDEIEAAEPIHTEASPQLIGALREFIHSGRLPATTAPIRTGAAGADDLLAPPANGWLTTES